MKDNADGPAQIGFFDLIDVDPVISDLTVSDIIKTVQQVRNGCFSRTGGAYKRHLLSGLGVKGDIMEYDLIFLIAKVYIHHPYIAGQTGIGDGSIRLVGMLPGPHMGSLLGFHQHSVFFLYLGQGHIAAVGFRLLVQQSENPLRAGDPHNHRVDLMGNLADSAGKLLGHIQEGHHHADAQRQAGNTQIRHP